jgi:hypothetical protein
VGTNYYWHESGEAECPHCKQTTPKIHIGKSSHGWSFSLRVHPFDGLHSLEDWKARWATGGAIFNEYQERVSVPDMLLIITSRDVRRRQSEVMPGHGYDCKPGGECYDLCNYEFS